MRRHRAHYNVIVMMTGNYHKSSLHSWRRKHVTSHQSLGLLFWFPVLKSIHCNAFHDRTLLNVLYLSDTGKSPNELQRRDFVTGHQDNVSTTYTFDYRKTASINRTKSPNLNVFHLILQLSLPNPLKPCVKLRTKM